MYYTMEAYTQSSKFLSTKEAALLELDEGLCTGVQVFAACPTA